MTGKNNRQPFWQQHLIKHQQSGLSGIQYCRQEQLTYHCFIYWRRKLETKDTVESTTPSHGSGKTPNFSQVISVSEPWHCHDALELSLPNGLVIGNIHNGNLKWVRPLLESL